jgi:glucokinase-like ROK family protein
MIKATQQQTKIHNRQLVLQTLYDQPLTSRANLARLTRLTRTTVSELVGELIAEGLVEEIGQGPSIGGKPPTMLNVVDNSRQIISVDLASNEFKGAVVNLRGQIRHQECLPVDNRDGDAALDLVYRLIDTLLRHTDAPVLGIGIGSPGLIDPQNGVIRYSVNLDWRDLPLARIIEDRYHLPVRVANNSQAAAMAEITFGSNRSEKNLIVLKVGRGIAAGIVINGKSYFGDGFGAGEIGHFVYEKDGEICRCGHRGCLETIASSEAILQKARRIMQANPGSLLHKFAQNPENLTLQDVVKAYQAGDQDMLLIIDEVANALGTVLANLVCAININTIIIAGMLTDLGEGFIHSIDKHIHQNAFTLLANQVHIQTSTLGRNIVILGVAAQLMQFELGLS